MHVVYFGASPHDHVCFLEHLPAVGAFRAEQAAWKDINIAISDTIIISYKTLLHQVRNIISYTI